MYRVLKAETQDQKEEAFALRREVFVDEQRVPRDLEFDEFEKESVHFIAVDGNGTTCGAARWRSTTDGVKLERFAVLATHRRRRIGSALMEAVLQDIAANPTTCSKRQYMNAQLDAVPLYAKFGFRPYGKVFEEANILHQAMERFQSDPGVSD
jgi:predicted GNAT family N-acyltransferase